MVLEISAFSKCMCIFYVHMFINYYWCISCLFVVTETNKYNLFLLKFQQLFISNSLVFNKKNYFWSKSSISYLIYFILSTREVKH